MRTRSILLWPFALVWGLLRLLFWPAAVLLIALLLTRVGVLPSGLFVLVVLVDAAWALWALRLWGAVVKGSMRSMARGTITVRNQRPRQRRRRQGARRGGARR